MGLRLAGLRAREQEGVATNCELFGVTPKHCRSGAMQKKGMLSPWSSINRAQKQWAPRGYVGPIESVGVCQPGFKLEQVGQDVNRASHFL